MSVTTEVVLADGARFTSTRPLHAVAVGDGAMKTLEAAIRQSNRRNRAGLKANNAIYQWLATGAGKKRKLALLEDSYPFVH